MPLSVFRRKDTGTLTIGGRLKLPNGERIRVRTRAASDSIELAREEAAALEARLLRDAWHGQRRGVRSFAEAVNSYLDMAPRAAGDQARLNRILAALGDVSLAAVDQAAVDQVCRRILRPGASPATVLRGVIAPIRAVMRHAHRRGWCDAPIFDVPRQPQGRTRYLLPAEAERLIDAAAPHVRPLLILLLATGARMAEAIELEWRDVDLAGARVIFWQTKSGARRVAMLPPRAVAALAALPHREGAVFRWQTTPPSNPKRKRAPARVRDYADRGRETGGHIRTAWKGAIRRGGLDPALRPHDLRHTWASWHYALYRDLLLLKQTGGWSSVELVERYSHLLPAGQEAAIRAFLGLAGTVLPSAAAENLVSIGR